MAREPRRRDWQERAFEENEASRHGRATGVQSDLLDPLKATTDTKRRSSWRLTAIAVMIVIAAIIIRVDLNNRPPSLTTSCTTPGFAFSSTSTHQGSTIRWAATGPANAHFVITLGVAELVHSTTPGHLHVVPEPGHAATTTEEVVPPTVLPTSCKTHGSFSVGVPKGHYTARMFRLQGSGSDVTGTSVASKEVTVS